jgi:hypothetical protein
MPESLRSVSLGLLLVAANAAEVSPAIRERDMFNGNSEPAARLDNAPIDPTLALRGTLR